MSTEHKYYGLFERGEVGFHSGKMSWVHWLAAALAAVTGAVHLFLYVDQAFPPFLFAGVVFFGAVLALLFNVYRRLLYVLALLKPSFRLAIW